MEGATGYVKVRSLVFFFQMSGFGSVPRQWRSYSTKCQCPSCHPGVPYQICGHNIQSQNARLEKSVCSGVNKR